MSFAVILAAVTIAAAALIAVGRKLVAKTETKLDDAALAYLEAALSDPAKLEKIAHLVEALAAKLPAAK